MPLPSSASLLSLAHGRGLSIRQKLIAILAIPAVVMIVLASVVVVGAVGDARRSDRLGQAARFTVNLTALAHELQRERDLSAAYEASQERAFYGDMIFQRVAVNEALRAVRGELATLDPDSYGIRLREQLARINEQFGQLRKLREDLDEDRARSSRDMLDVFTQIVATFIEAEVAVGSEAGDAGFARDVATLIALSRTKEAVALERSTVLSALVGGRLVSADVERVSSLGGGEQTWLGQFRASATDAQRRAYEQQVTGPDNERFERLRGRLLAQVQRGRVSVGAQEWLLTANAKVDLLRDVEAGLVSDVAAASARAAAGNRQRAIVVVVVVALAVLMSGLFSLLLAQTMVLALSRLRDAATEVASHRLPEAVERLQHFARPEEVVPSPPISLGTDDETAEVAEAFNAVHTVAVDIATRQAALRRSVGDLFLNLAQRNQSMLDKQLELIDDLEQTEDDPDALKDLFRLDHLATRMRRTAEDLIVLSGANPPRVWSRPVPILEALRGAMAEIEHYARVEIVSLQEMSVVGTVASDVVHLLAELIENATAFSPPTTGVFVSGSNVAKGYVIEIEDQGVGMPDEQLLEANQRLAEPSEIDFGLARRLGLFVVGRLASRQGISIQLRRSWYGGIVALVLLPPELLVYGGHAGQQAAEGPDRPTMPLANGDPGGSGPALPHLLEAVDATNRSNTASGLQAAHIPIGRHASLPKRVNAQTSGWFSGGRPRPRGTAPGRPGGGPKERSR